ncbi:MAG: imidazoleglycerol-phosphate dehydratase HisB [Candidatus Margulisbacteria bacterium]|nr:imidazoleglycerol-phosphate dehydratase HisB [Candidatus Margulisiibacteriota bacterium]MBU1021911.1 imidazoleglycerol-phosphate dehydratase HisB [Candidatus Margulisiibacteriota bacterium]MBU1728549.1 imidazoleglycerol-phosphate dehydratase HisB [Candidatus Margulisiibacteriota bacterium]MBU1954696.1 imidazoleglycerol-phosphate dehydratase HisB [Candidatus Margulisiibacteriota bacterium]
MPKKRIATIARKTKETNIKLKINLDGTGKSKIKTGIGFFDHMLDLFSKHSLIDLDVSCKGDTHVDMHHTVEDVGICLGQALKKALGKKAGIERYSSVTLPMDEALCEIVIDISGRPHLTFNVDFPKKRFDKFDQEVVKEFFEALVINALVTVHVNLIRGTNTHHIIEAIFKAFGVALSKACQLNPRKKGVPSTKGVL